MQTLVDVQRAAATAVGRHQEQRDIEAGSFDSVQRAAHHIVHRQHGNGDVGVVGLIERNKGSGRLETLANCQVGSDFQRTHEHNPSACPDVMVPGANACKGACVPGSTTIALFGMVQFPWLKIRRGDLAARLFPPGCPRVA
ncbi:hypothetical protein D3C80_1662930 [compost metagenome]